MAPQKNIITFHNNNKLREVTFILLTGDEVFLSYNQDQIFEIISSLKLKIFSQSTTIVIHSVL